MVVTSEAVSRSRTISVAHSPDSDDAFMFYGLATNKLETNGLKFEHTLKDIQSLNEDAKHGVYDVTAVSFHAYAYVGDKYALLPHGASIGDKYGPILVSKEPRKIEEIGGGGGWRVRRAVLVHGSQIGPVPGSNSWLYRVSKAALNMAVSSARFDYPKATLVALDPGWVQTDMGGGAAPLTAEASVRGLRAVLAGLTPGDNGQLIHHDGRRASSW